MRLTAKNLKTVYLKKYTAVKDKYGYITKGWSAAEPVRMTIEPAGGAVNAQIYGESLNYMLVNTKGKQLKRLRARIWAFACTLTRIASRITKLQPFRNIQLIRTSPLRNGAMLNEL